ncbi:MAG TPA: helicase-related protein [Anaerolineae bacterium]|nr:helicase-related protein [Anaerolineae bacterium]
MNAPQIEAASTLAGRRVYLPGHFAEPVQIEAVRPLGTGFELRVRRASGQLEETVLSAEEIQGLLGAGLQASTAPPLADPHHLRLLIESARIRLAYAYDPHFAVSISGIRTLPHQIEAVYLKMLPQPRLRFLLADDPGAGKTIMAGLLIKEMKLRQAIERILILVPAPLSIQWQDELVRFFGEGFQIVHAGNDRQQLADPWQRENQVIASMDYAKQEGVRERVWQQRWDLVVIDEAHKCSAYTRRRSGRSAEAEKTRRYQLAERLVERADHVLLLTATPHHGDDDRFGHFVRLIDPDLFPPPHQLGEQARDIRRDILRLGEDSPWALRRLKEDLRDAQGRRLFPDRHTHTVTFCLNAEEFALYAEVTAYINQFLPHGVGKQKASVALTRTVLQRRLASSTRAIYESLHRRLERQRKLLEELEAISPHERMRYLEALRGRLTDAELDEDDLDEEARDRLSEEFTTALELEQLRMEVATLKELIEQARRVWKQAPDSKLAALRKTLEQAQFAELGDGRGKLLIFTEHRDTLAHLREHLRGWGYSTCEIHGGMDPYQRKAAQEEFRTACQVCVATEAAGEGINLQFCHLMINYDLPWNPTRLEQRMGRIHRIGQERDVTVFNFVADRSEEGQPVVEGRILARLLEKLEQMRDALGHERVYDVVGEVLSLNQVNLPEMLREAAYDPRRLEEYLDRIDRMEPRRLQEYEEATGIALARSCIDFGTFQQANFEAEERRLMPEYVARQFLAAAELMGLRVETRADGLWRLEHVPADLRSERLEAVQRLGRPEPAYRKLTVHKEHLEQNQHLDAVLVGPGHSLYAALDERLNERLAALRGSTAAFVDATATAPYWIHFLEMEVRGEEMTSGVLYAELIAVREERRAKGEERGARSEGRFTLLPPDVLHDLAPHPDPPADLPLADPQEALDFLKAGYQLAKRREVQAERQHYAGVVREYLERSFQARIQAVERRVMALRAREASGEDVALALRQAEQDLADLHRGREARLSGLERLTVARSGPARYLATLLVLPPGEAMPAWPQDEDARQRMERAAMQVVTEYEQRRGWEPFDISAERGPGFDVRSLGPADPATGYRPVRRIEVKGRAGGQPVRMTTNEWLKARQLGETYWLYVVWDPHEPEAEPVCVQDPAHALEHAVREVQVVAGYEVPAEAIVGESQTR